MPFREIFSSKIVELFLNTDEFREADCVFCYVSMSDEVQTMDLLQSMLSMSKTVCVPFICKGIMNAAVISSIGDLENGKYGIPTVKNKKAIVIAPHQIDCVIVPGTAFGRDGSRVGMGGGFYDRYLLEATEAKRIGICFSCQMFAAVPTEKHDLFMDLVITEEEVIRRKSKGTEKVEKR